MDWIIEQRLREQIRNGTLSALPSSARAEAVATQLITEVGRPDAEVSILLTDDPGIHLLNRQWRNIDKPTDVLSWPQEDQPFATDSEEDYPDILGDVAISLDTAARQALTRDWPVEEEIALLLVHGILHLLGHEDDTEEGAEGMRAIERRLLGKPLEKIE